jgi:TolB-like protein/class 3 adenylate cyclase
VLKGRAAAMVDPVGRRLAAILAADVVGYSRLMEADEGGTHARLKSVREALIDPSVARHQGRIVKLIGDGALVEFSSVVQAVQCAIAIQRAMAEQNAALAEDQRIVFRIGVNLGDVIVEADDIYGGGVNVAARLEGLAEPGSILISGTAYDQVEGRLDCGFAFAGEQQVKNIERPVRTYRVLLDGEARRPARPPTTAARVTRLWWAGGTVAVVLLIGLASWLQPWKGADENVAEVPTADDLDPKRIAVLPFVNMSADAENEYFADGITEELITELSRIGELSVIARTSVMKFKGTEQSIAEIGRELNVGTVLEGSVRKAGDQVRISAQLIDVASEAHLWADDYDRSLEAIFAIQSDVAEQVAEALKIALTKQVQKSIQKPGTTNVDAYQLYLEALDANARGDVPESVEMLREAVSLDPSYAAAWAALAEFTNSLFWYVDIPAIEAYRQAMDAAERALALDDSLARAHLALARAKLFGDFDWDAAERGFERAIALNPSFAKAHQIYAHYFLLAVKGRNDDALVEIERALELDPLWRESWESLGWIHYHRKEFDQARVAFRRKQKMVPDDPWPRIGIGQSFVFEGRYGEGIAEIQKAVESAPDYHFLLGYLAWANGMAGRDEEAEDAVSRLKEAAETGDISPMAFAWAYTGMGDIDNAVAALEQAYEARDFAIIFIRVPEFYEVLSGDRRYRALLERMGLES